jgi:F420-non-reducing hydrogenase small subunit
MGTNVLGQTNGKLKIGMYWASSCGGCDISLLEIGPRILELIQIADVVLWPCVADFKYRDVATYPDGYMDVCFYNGGIRSSEQEEIARLLRKKSKTLIGYGACAVGGGIPALANLKSRAELYDVVYHQNPSIDNREGVEPQSTYATPFGEVGIPEFYPAVLRLKDVVPVDYEIPDRKSVV